MDSSTDLTIHGIIHDLNNVFQTLFEAAHLLSEDPKWTPVSAAILRSIERGKEITSTLYTVEQPSAPFEDVLSKAVALVQDLMMSRRHPEIDFTFEVEPGLILRNAWAWERVLTNLFTNSIQAMPQGGTITVRARRVDSGIQISVADEGLGIAPGLLPVIFDPQVSTKSEGGLGLHIVRTIVEQEDGEVRAANRTGRGAEFIITIPDRPSRIQRASA